MLCLWDDGCQVALHSLRDILCPDIYPDDSSLAPMLDVAFRLPVQSLGDLLTVSLNMLLLDVTGRPLPALAALRDTLGRLGQAIDQPGALAELAAL